MSTSPHSAAPVLLATDGTAASNGALRYAVRHSVARGADLRILHVLARTVPMPPLLVVEPPDLGQYARNVLTRVADEARDLAPELTISTLHAQGVGGRVRAIVDASADAQLVVVGRETSHGLERLLTGATTAGVAAHARCPVVVVPSDWSPRDAAEGRGTVVVGIRRPDDASHVMAVAYEQAMALDADITVVHAWEMPDPYVDRIEARTHLKEWEALGQQVLDEALGHWRDQYPHLPLEAQIVHGHAASELAAAAKAADLLIVRRAHEHRPFDHLGATVRALLLASPAPVEVVPARVNVPRPSSVADEETGGTAR